MSEEEKTLIVQKHDAPAEWGDRADIAALADRLKVMMPGKLTQPQALLLAQYSAAMDANPFRGEVYAYEHRGKLILVEGYKLLVRWARNQCQFYERYERVSNGDDTIPKDAIAFRCRILRQDAVSALAELTKAGIPNAYEIVSTEAIGVVTKADRTKRDGNPQDPPVGWTWEDVARKRALKNALNRAYGAPSPREIAEASWMVRDTVTIPEDWVATLEMGPKEREAVALYNARQRGHLPLPKSAAESIVELFGDGETGEIVSEETGEIVGMVPDVPPEPEGAVPEMLPGLELAEPESESLPELPGAIQEPPGNGIVRPAPAETVKEWLTQKAGQLSHYRPPTQGQLGLMNGLLSKIMGGDQERRTWLEWTWGTLSSKELSGGQVGATLGWLKAVKDTETGEYIPLDVAVAEARIMLRQALLDKGQADMFDEADEKAAEGTE